MTNDLPAELGRDLARLGRVEPPAPGVLDAARERLWAAVAAEMLSTQEDAGARNTAARESPRHARRLGDPDT